MAETKGNCVTIKESYKIQFDTDPDVNVVYEDTIPNDNNIIRIQVKNINYSFREYYNLNLKTLSINYMYSTNRGIEADDYIPEITSDIKYFIPIQDRDKIVRDEIMKEYIVDDILYINNIIYILKKGKIEVWNIDKKNKINTFICYLEHELTPISKIIMSCDKKYLYSSSFKEFKIWNIKTNSLIYTSNKLNILGRNLISYKAKGNHMLLVDDFPSRYILKILEIKPKFWSLYTHKLFKKELIPPFLLSCYRVGNEETNPVPYIPPELLHYILTFLGSI